MGKMKEFLIDLVNANGFIPSEITMDDVIRMKELEIYNWKEYEKAKNKSKTKDSSKSTPKNNGGGNEM